jgi:ABC-type multidrug transport system fused ATPase/permease subunit
VRDLPLADPGSPDVRSPARYLWWVGRQQWRTLAGGLVFGVVWMTGQAVVPALIGRAIDQGVTTKDVPVLAEWSLVLVAVGAVQAVAGVFRHRFAVGNWLTAVFRTQQIVARHVSRLGASLPAQAAVGEVVSVTATDVFHVGNAFDISARAAGAVVSFLVVAVILLHSSTFLGLIVLTGVPLLMLCVTPLLRPLKRRQAEQRRLVGELTTLGTDTVAGLRVLRGIGGEETFLQRFRSASQDVRLAGVRVAGVQAWLDAAQVLLPGVFVVLVTWLGARLAVEGELSIGELVAFYGYAAFLVTPLRTATEAADKITKAMVSSGRILEVLRLRPVLAETAEPAPEPSPGSPMHDSASGLDVRPGQLLGLACGVPEDSARLLDRLARYADPEPGESVTFGGVRLAELPLDAVRRRILLNDKDPRLFTGTLRDELDPWGRTGGDDRLLLAALDAAGADDVLEALAGGLDAEVEERGRSFSGGQRQRLVLARSLVMNPEVLLLDEPTSAVDAHTEARVAQRLSDVRAGRTTVVASTSPLVLEWCDEVAFLVDGEVAALGPHRTLLHTDDRYRTVVTRGEAELVGAEPSSGGAS